MGKKSLIKSTSKKKSVAKAKAVKAAKVAKAAKVKKEMPKSKATAKSGSTVKKQKVTAKNSSEAQNSKKPTVKELLFKKFDVVPPKKLYKVDEPQMGPDDFLPTSFLADKSKKEADRIRPVVRFPRKFP